MDKWTKDRIKHSPPAKLWRKYLDMQLRNDMCVLFLAVMILLLSSISVSLICSSLWPFIIVTVFIVIVFGFYITKHVLLYTNSLNMLYKLNNEEYDVYIKEHVMAKSKTSSKFGLIMTKGIDLYTAFIPWDRIQSITFTYRRQGYSLLFLLLPDDPYYAFPATMVVKVWWWGPINIKIVLNIDEKRDISSDIKSFIDEIHSCTAESFAINNNYHFVDWLQD